MPPRRRAATPKGKRGSTHDTSRSRSPGRGRGAAATNGHRGDAAGATSNGVHDDDEGDASEMRPSVWAQKDRSKDFAQGVRKSDIQRGLVAELRSGVAWVVLASLVVYGGVVVWRAQMSYDDVIEAVRVFGDTAYAAVHDFAAGAATQPGVIVFLLLAVVAATALFARRERPTYLIDFTTFTPPDSLRVTSDVFLERSKACGKFSDESIEFQEKILKSSTLCEETYFPPGIMRNPMTLNMDSAREEAMLVMGGSVEELFRKTGTSPKAIDVVVVNCSLFCPTPSLASMLVNKFKMRSDVLHYSLGGMGCSAGLISVDLVERVMASRPNTTALVVSTENITLNWYRGNQKSMLISNCLFRCGAAAVLLSNKRRDAGRAKFRLKHLVRTHQGAKQEAYESVYQVEDDKQVLGVRLSRKIMQVAGDALRSNMTRLGPLVLPVTEQAIFVFNLISRKVLQGKLPKPIPRVVGVVLQRMLLLALATPGVGHFVRATAQLPPDAGKPLEDGSGVEVGKPYVPDFRKAFNYFCIHAGGRAVLDAIENNLQLTARDMEPSRATLARMGNTSSSSVWYEMDYIRRNFGVKRGERVWQIAFGSGFLCNSAVWEAMRTVTD